MHKKSHTVKLRMTADEHRALSVRAGGKGKLSAFIRQQVFGQERDTTLALARIHGTALQIARALGHRHEPLPVSVALAHLISVERHLHDFLTRTPP